MSTQSVPVNRLPSTNHQYLASGILESYLLGLVADDEKQQLEHLLATDPDVLADLNELEVQMETYFSDNAVPPPPGLKAAIERRINGTEIEKRDSDSHSRLNQPVPETEPPKPNYIDVEISDTHIRVHKNWRTAFIAVFILSKVFLVLGLYFYFKSDSQEQEIRRLKADAGQTAPLSRSIAP